MKTSSITTVFAVGALLLGGTFASAASINGSLTFSGDFQPTGGTNLGDATGIDFLGDDFDVDGATGDFSLAGIVQGDIGTINDFQFDPLLAPVSPLWAIDIFSFELDTITIVLQQPEFLLLEGTGTVSGIGFDDTAGSWSLSANASGSLFNFSSGTTVAPIPLPGALLLFGSAVALLGWRRRD